MVQRVALSFGIRSYRPHRFRVADREECHAPSLPLLVRFVVVRVYVRTYARHVPSKPPAALAFFDSWSPFSLSLEIIGNFLRPCNDCALTDTLLFGRDKFPCRLVYWTNILVISVISVFFFFFVWPNANFVYCLSIIFKFPGQKKLCAHTYSLNFSNCKATFLYM